MKEVNPLSESDRMRTLNVFEHRSILYFSKDPDDKKAQVSGFSVSLLFHPNNAHAAQA